MKRKLKKPVALGLCILLGLVLILGGILLVQVLTDPMDCRMAQGVTIGGLDVGGMTPVEAGKALKAAAKETLQKEPMTAVLPGGELTIDPKEAGLGISTWKAVGDAYRVGRQEDSTGLEFPLSSYLTYKESYFRNLLETYASKHDTLLTKPQWKLRGQVPDLGTDVFDKSAPGQTVELTLGLPERHLDVADALAQILVGYDRALLGIEKITVNVPCKVEPEQPNLQEIYDTCLIQPKNDEIDLETHSVNHGSFGCHFDMEKAKEMVEAAAYGETISIPMEALEPEIWGEGIYYRDVLGTCETKHSDDENRNTNLRLVCEALDGLVIQPGEEFSYNEAVGERTPERGFLPATVFAGSHIAKDYGGGVCQGSTTLYNCLLLADMQVTERHGHGAMVTYIKLGLDAAVNWGTKTDLRFINNSHFPVKIQAEVSDGYMKMKLLGTDEKDYYVQLEAKQYEEGGYIYAASYMLKFDKQTQEQLSRDRIAFSSYDLNFS